MDPKPRVLVLDEDPLALELYARELGQDYHVFTSSSLEETRQSLRNSSCDVLIMEPAVGEDSGWAFIKEICAANNPPLLILCSVRDDRKTGLELGAHAFLVKPVLPVTLHTLLNRMVARNPSFKVETPDERA